jgi:hypothetical protein
MRPIKSRDHDTHLQRLEIHSGREHVLAQIVVHQLGQHTHLARAQSQRAIAITYQCEQSVELSCVAGLKQRQRQHRTRLCVRLCRCCVRDLVWRQR